MVLVCQWQPPWQKSLSQRTYLERESSQLSSQTQLLLHLDPSIKSKESTLRAKIMKNNGSKALNILSMDITLKTIFYIVFAPSSCSTSPNKQSLARISQKTKTKIKKTLSFINFQL